MSAIAETISFEPHNTRGWPRTKKQLEFALQVVQFGYPPFRAMMNAGYTRNTAKVESHKLAKKLRPFFVFLQEKKNQLAEAHYDVTNTRILSEMSAIGLQNIKDYVRIVTISGKLREIGKPISDLTNQQALAVSSWSKQLIKTDDGEEFDYQYVLHDKAGALVNLGKHLGMFSEKLMLDLNMRRDKADAIDFSAMPQNDLEMVIETLRGFQEKAAKARVIEGQSHRID